MVGNQCQPRNYGMRRDPEIVIADYLAHRFQFRPNRSISFGCRFRQGERGQQLQKLTQPLARRNPLRALGCAIKQLTISNNGKRRFSGTKLTESAQDFVWPLLPDFP